MVKSNETVNTNDIYGKTILASSVGAKTNSYTYQKMKNKIKYGINKDKFLNKGSRKVVK